MILSLHTRSGTQEVFLALKKGERVPFKPLSRCIEEETILFCIPLSCIG